MTFDSQVLKTSVTSMGSKGTATVPLSFRMVFTLISIFCLLTSFLT